MAPVSDRFGEARLFGQDGPLPDAVRRLIIELLALIERGPAAIQLIYRTSLYRISVPEDDDPNGGVWISLSSDGRYIVEDYAAVHARVDGREIRLTQREANFVRGLVAMVLS